MRIPTNVCKYMYVYVDTYQQHVEYANTNYLVHGGKPEQISKLINACSITSNIMNRRPCCDDVQMKYKVLSVNNYIWLPEINYEMY